MKIHKGDTVIVAIGKDRGKRGKVISVSPKDGSVLVEGMNLYKKHSRPKRQGEKGETVVVPRGLDVSKVMIYCVNCARGTRVGFRVEGGRKTRFCRRCRGTL